MVEVETGRYTIGVFKDVPSATRGIDALKRQGFPVEALTVMAREGPETASLLHDVFGRVPDKVELRGLGTAVAMGTLLSALSNGAADLPRQCLATWLQQVGFQPHDGRIFETLVGRGGVLVGVRTEPRAADALATLHCYGGGNAAIGAWTGRL